MTYIFNVRTFAGNEDQGTELIDNYDVIADSNEQIEQYLETEYNLNGFTRDGDPENMIYEKSYKAWCSDHGNVHEVTEECNDCTESENSGNGELCENHFWYNESVTAFRESATKNNLEYLKSGKHYNRVVDLTE